jgi:orotate phosphoribosyltransferase-like protein
MAYIPSVVNEVAYMDFKRATEELMAGMTRGEIADALGVSEATVRQARLGESANAHRKPPEGWEGKVAKLAKARAERLRKLAEALR